MIIGSVATSLAAGGGFCAGSHVVVDHQRINGAAFVFSASMPGLLATSASEGISILRNTPSLLSTLQENVRAIRTVLDSTSHVHVPSHPASPLIHLHLATPLGDVPTPLGALPAPTPAQIAPAGPPPFDIAAEDAALQAIADECIAQGVLVVRAQRLRGQEMVEARPSLRLAVSAALSRKECERAALVIKAACAKVLAKRK
jgi:serine palmitoyltransferase